jgi:two-component system response regulator CpxR
MGRVLLVDDDTELCAMLAEYLQPEGFEVVSVHEGEAALERVATGAFDAVVLDVMLTGLSGFDVLRRVRETSRVPILMLTARGQDVDRIVGLEMGADDYLPKPFNPRELVARLRAVLRRAQDPAGGAAAERIVVGDVALDPGTRTVHRGEQPVALTSTEFTVLDVLMRHAGRVVGKDELSRDALGRELGRYDRSLDMHISNLRRKLGPAASGAERIQTVRGVGYQYLRS